MRMGAHPLGETQSYTRFFLCVSVVVSTELLRFMVAEAFLPTFGILGIGGILAFVVGSIILMNTEVSGVAVAWPSIAAIALLSAALFGVAWMALKARRRRVVSGSEDLVPSLGVALEDFSERGRVRVHSEDWQARARIPVHHGQTIRVVAREGLILTVEPTDTPSGD